MYKYPNIRFLDFKYLLVLMPLVEAGLHFVGIGKLLADLPCHQQILWLEHLMGFRQHRELGKDWGHALATQATFATLTTPSNLMMTLGPVALVVGDCG